ncbi:hypothetical protein Trydic_g18067 [Trypoxylus dichotomus]
MTNRRCEVGLRLANNRRESVGMENQRPDDLQGDYQNVGRTAEPQCYKNVNEQKLIEMDETSCFSFRKEEKEEGFFYLEIDNIISPQPTKAD